MKRILMMVIAVSSLMVAQDAAGNYKLSGLNVTYYDVARYTTPIVVDDIYGAGVSLAISAIEQGEIFYATFNGPHSEAYLTYAGVNLNVNLYPDGTGHIAEGSFYPDVNPVDCISSVQVLPITDELIYTSDLGAGLSWPATNIAGLPSHNPYAYDPSTAGTVGSFSLSQSVIFDFFPAIPTQTSVPFPIHFGDFNGNGAIDYELGEGIPPGYTLPGTAGGLVQIGEDNPSIMVEDLDGDGNPEPNAPWDLTLEWHAIDGALAESGLGDIVGEDEDGDGTDYDRIFGLPYITAAYLNPDPSCGGFNYPIFGGQPVVDAMVATVYGGYFGACSGAGGVWEMIYGGCLLEGGDEATCAGTADASGIPMGAGTDYCDPFATSMADGWELTCVDVADGLANDAYVMDPSLEAWGNFLTLNAAMFQGCLAQTGGDPVPCLGYMVDDSDHDFNGVDGKLVMRFSPTCIPEIEIRQVTTEFYSVDDVCAHSGDATGDGVLNVQDIVRTIDHILGGTPLGGSAICEADMNDDGIINVIDIVGMVNAILGGSRAVDAEASYTMDANTIVATNVAGIQVDGKLVSSVSGNDIVVEGNGTTIVYNLNGKLDTQSFEFDNVSNQIVVGQDGVIATLSEVASYELRAAYPNPFNPSTSINLTLDIATDVSVKVYNAVGQLVSVIAEGNMNADSYNFTWDAGNVSSGVYFITTQVGADMNTQKVMLMK